MRNLLKNKAFSALTGFLFLVTTAAPSFADYNSQCTSAAIAASDQVKAYCAQAGTARSTAQFQTTKAIVETAAAATLTVLAFALNPATQNVCPTIEKVAIGTGIGLDVIGAVKSKDYMTGLLSAGSSVMVMTLGSKFINTAAEKAADFATKFSKNLQGSDGKSDKAQNCFKGAITTGISAATAAFAASTAKKAENSALSSASSLVASETSNGFTTGVGTGTTTASTGSSGSAGSATSATADCSSKSGTDYITCTGGAESAALTNPDVVSAIESNLKGTSLGDLAKNYTGDGSPASIGSYVGSAMGMNSDGQKSLAEAMKNAGALAGTNDDAYSAAKYVSNGGKVDTGSGDTDFNKMMGNMLSKLNPEGDKKGQDPSSAVFRQLDLLSPDKIAANKDISLFARVGYRYRKKSSDVDQLNWAAPSNTTTTTTSAPMNSTRTPASKN